MDCCKWTGSCTSFSCHNIETRDMPDHSTSVAAPAALPFVVSVDYFSPRAGLPLPAIERIQGDEMPEPYRSLLVHERDMTPTLQNFHRAEIHLKILNREQRGDFYFREVALLLDETNQPV